MRTFLSAVAVAAVSISVVWAAGMEGFFGNTLVIRDAKGAVLARTQFKADGTYETVRGANTRITGKWRVDGANICTTEAGSDDEECVGLNLDGKTKGQNWTVSSDGLNLRLSLE